MENKKVKVYVTQVTNVIFCCSEDKAANIPYDIMKEIVNRATDNLEDIMSGFSIEKECYTKVNFLENKNERND